MLKSQRKAAEDAAKANVISLEEFLEVEASRIVDVIFQASHIVILQRHKLGSNLTPVTPETFALWKKTRMDKKEAELEALRKAKETHHAAGKNSGMSGRDLVCINEMIYRHPLLTPDNSSSSTTQNGSKMMTMNLRIGICRHTVGRKANWGVLKTAFKMSEYTMMTEMEIPGGLHRNDMYNIVVHLLQGFRILDNFWLPFFHSRFNGIVQYVRH